MKLENENSTDPQVHCAHLERQLEELIRHARADAQRVAEPRFQALLETSAEVLTGLQTAFRHYARNAEPAWRDSSPRKA